MLLLLLLAMLLPHRLAFHEFVVRDDESHHCAVYLSPQAGRSQIRLKDYGHDGVEDECDHTRLRHVLNHVSEDIFAAHGPTLDAARAGRGVPVHIA